MSIIDPRPTLPVQWLQQDGKNRARLLGPWRPPSGPGTRVLLLIHGLSAASNTFLVQDGGSGIADYLRRNGDFDVWFLDWRGSGDPAVVAELVAGLEPCLATCTPAAPCAGCEQNVRHFNLDAVARYDHGQALGYIQAQYGNAKTIDVLAHCVGAGSFAMCIADGWATGKGVGKVVLDTLSLFFRVSRNRQLLIQDYILERLLPADLAKRWMKVYAADPLNDQTWPDQLAIAWEVWRAAKTPIYSLPPAVEDDPEYLRLTFLYGEPFEYELVESVREATLRNYFGDLNLGLCQHVAEISRRGFAGTLEALGPSLSYLRAPRLFFDDVDRVTFVTGRNNLLWHRECGSRMEEWLQNELGKAKAPYHRIEVPGYAHQDLLWARHATTDVYPKILGALT